MARDETIRFNTRVRLIAWVEGNGWYHTKSKIVFYPIPYIIFFMIPAPKLKLSMFCIGIHALSSP